MIFRESSEQGGSYVAFDGNIAELTRSGDTLLFDNTKFKEGSKVGGKFYDSLFDYGAKTNTKIKPDGKLIDRAEYRYPIAIMKRYEKGLPIDHIYIGENSLATDRSIQTEARAILQTLEANTKKGKHMAISKDNKAMLERIAR